MTDIVIVVDAQNGFCDPRCKELKQFVKTKKMIGEVRQTIARIKLFLADARGRGIPVFYLCANEGLLFTNLDYSVQIHSELVPQKGEEVLWRKTPNKKNDESLFEDSLLFLARFSDPRLLLCGFYSDKCVTSAALCALKMGYRIAFVTDCVFPLFDGRKQKWFLGIQEYVSFVVDFSRVEFLPMADIFHGAEPPVPK